MMATRSMVLPPKLANAQQRIEKWRASGRPRRRLPDSIWTMAAELVPAYGVYRVARALRLEYRKVKEAAESYASKTDKTAKATFIQLAPSVRAPTSPGMDCTVELADANGRQMTVHAPAATGLADLVVAFFQETTCSR